MNTVAAAPGISTRSWKLHRLLSCGWDLEERFRVSGLGFRVWERRDVGPDGDRNGAISIGHVGSVGQPGLVLVSSYKLRELEARAMRCRDATTLNPLQAYGEV